MEPSETPLTEGTKAGGIGPMAGIVIVVILLAVGGMYFLYQEQQRIHAPPIEEHLNA